MHILRWFVVLAMVVSVTGNVRAGGWDKAAKAAKSVISKAAKKGTSLADDMPPPRIRRLPKEETVEKVKKVFADESCQGCGGNGWVQCRVCAGFGVVYITQTDYYGNAVSIAQRCAACNSKGVLRCGGCNGSGKQR